MNAKENRELYLQQKKKYSLFVDTAEGIRAPKDRVVATRRAKRAWEKYG